MGADDPDAPFMPYDGAAADPVLNGRYERLGELDEGTFGRAFFDDYDSNRYAFSGVSESLAEAWATPHDSLHVLSGYSTSAQGELLVAAFTAGCSATASTSWRAMCSQRSSSTTSASTSTRASMRLPGAHDRGSVVARQLRRQRHLALDAAKQRVAWNGDR